MSLELLTDRERQVLQQISETGHVKGTAAALGLSERTVEHHLARVRKKLNCESTVQAVSLFVREQQPPSLPLPPEVLPKGRPWGLFLVLTAVSALSLVAYKAWSPASPPIPLQTEDIDEDFRFGVLPQGWILHEGIGIVRFDGENGTMEYVLDRSTDKASNRQLTTLSKPFRADTWTLVAKVTFQMPVGNGRHIFLGVVFGDDPLSSDNQATFSWHRDFGGPPALSVSWRESGRDSAMQRPWPVDSVTCWLKLRRIRESLFFAVSLDGDTYEAIAETEFSRLPDLQSLVVSGRTYADLREHPEQKATAVFEHIRVDVKSGPR